MKIYTVDKNVVEFKLRKHENIDDDIEKIVFEKDSVCRKITINKIELKNLKEIIIPKSVIEVYGFQGLENLEKLEFEKGSECTMVYGFNFAKKLTKIDFPESVVKIYGFVKTGLKEVVIPKNVKILSGFHGCNNLEKMVIEEAEGPLQMNISGISKLKKLKELVIPSKCSYIYKGSLTSNKNLEKIVFKGGKENKLDIKTNFHGCIKLREIEFPINTAYVGFFGMKKCDNSNLTYIFKKGTYFITETFKIFDKGMKITRIGNKLFIIGRIKNKRLKNSLINDIDNIFVFGQSELYK